MRGVIRTARFSAQADTKVKPAGGDFLDPLDFGFLAAFGSFVLFFLDFRLVVLFHPLTPVLSHKVERVFRFVLFALRDWDNDFQFGSAEAAHGLFGHPRFEFEEGFVDSAQVFNVEGAIVDPLA
ncbi:MAG: hypothetical protein HDKAJFGB_04079 [Anaerolineae bacterium]|nr:hypothetical protein [Anaerolineae bacterium]